MNDTNVTSVNPKKEINYQYKILYAIGIIYVLMAHSHGESLGFWTETVNIAGFVLAMFVFASGYFYNKKVETNILPYILKKAGRLLVPLYLWQIFYAIVVIVFSKFGFSYGSPVTFKNLILSPLISAHLMGFNDPAWFIFPLFLTEVYNVLIRKALSRFNEKGIDIGLLIFHFLVGFAGIYLSLNHKNKEWWLLLTRFMYFVPFFTLGTFYRRYLEKKDTLPSFWYFSIIIAIDILIILAYGHASRYSIVIMDENYFENPVMPFVVGILGIALYLRVGRILNPVIGKSKYLNLLADNTFPIMIHHATGFFVLKCLFLLATKVISALPEFSIELFKNDLTYIYLPRGRGFQLLYIFFGCLIPILMQKAVVLLKNRIIGDKHAK